MNGMDAAQFRLFASFTHKIAYIVRLLTCKFVCLSFFISFYSPFPNSFFEFSTKMFFRPLTAFSIFVAFFLVHCYPLPQYVQQARADVSNGQKGQQQKEVEEDGPRPMTAANLKKAENNDEILTKIGTMSEAVENADGIFGNEKKGIQEWEDSEGKYFPKEWQKLTKTTTTTERGGMDKMDEGGGEEGKAVLLRPVSWQQSSTKPTIIGEGVRRMRRRR